MDVRGYFGYAVDVYFFYVSAFDFFYVLAYNVGYFGFFFFVEEGNTFSVSSFVRVVGVFVGEALRSLGSGCVYSFSCFASLRSSLFMFC